MTDQTLHSLLQTRFGEAVPVPDPVAASPVLREMAGHRSHRRFEPEEVPAALLDTLFACAFSAPAKSDLQQACVVHVRDPGLRERMNSLFPRAAWVATAPVFLVWCGDNRRIRRICELRGKPFANDHLDSFFNAAVDAALVMSNFIRAVQAAGLGCCPLSELRNSASQVADWLGLPQHVFPVAGMVVGRPAAASPISARLPQALTVHRDRYDDSTLEREIGAYDRRRRELQPIADDKQRLSGHYGVIADYGWSEDKARQVSEAAREDFGAFIRAQGFCLE